MYIKVLLVVHIREPKQLAQDLRELMEPNIVGDPVQLWLEIVLIENAQIRLAQLMQNVKRSCLLLLHQKYNYVLLMAKLVLILERPVHSLKEMMTHVYYSQLMMVHAKQVLFQHLLLLVLLEFVMKLQTHIQQMINVRNITHHVKQQVEDVRALLDVEN